VGSSKTKPVRTSQPEDPASQVHKAFRRMALMLANLVCGIWLILFVTMAALDDNRPGLGSIAIVFLVTVPIAYVIPYGVVRTIGFVLVALKKHER
jgi:Na+/melibiose symporter-like transporter